MKNKLTALMTAAMMIASASATLPAQAADVTEQTITIPEWIPKSFDEALDFRNTYGATHIGKNARTDDTVCIVFSESPQNEYIIENGNEELDEIFHESFTDDSSHLKYEVVAYTVYQQNAGLCHFSVDLTDKNEEIICQYLFGSYGSGHIDEEDEFSWLPDCKAEYDEYVKANGEVSIKNDYVIFCLESNAGTPYEWTAAQDFADSALYRAFRSDCTEERKIPLDGGKECRIQAFSFDANGRAKLEYDLVPVTVSQYKPEDIVKSLIADCMVLDEGDTILLNGNVRYTFRDIDTGKTIGVPNSSVKMDVSPSIGYKTDTEGVYIYEDTQVVADSNPYLWNNRSDKIPDVFDVNLNEKALPYGYKLPEDYKTITKYENGSYDVEFRLKQDENCLAPNTVRVTLYDLDTGELIPDDMLALHRFSFGTDIRFRDRSNPDIWMMTGPVFPVETNPQIYNDNLPNLYRSADQFSISSPYEHEIKAYDNNSMDITFRVRFESYGDINGDNSFNVADLLMMEKWILTGTGNEYARWFDADFCTDGKIDVFDLCIMRKKLIEQTNNTYTDFDVKYIHTDQIDGYAGYPQTDVIKNTDELESYIDSRKDSLDLTEFKEASKDYDEKWFKDHKLLVITFESTVNVSHRVTGIIKGKKDKYSGIQNDYVEIECIVPEEGRVHQLINRPQILIELDSSFEISDRFQINTTDVPADK